MKLKQLTAIFIGALGVVLLFGSCEEAFVSSSGEPRVADSVDDGSEPQVGDSDPAAKLDASADVANDQSSELLAFGGEKVPAKWFRQQSEIVQKRISSGQFVIGSYTGGVRLGVIDENGDFATWEGSREAYSFSDHFRFFTPEEIKPVSF